MDKEQVAQILVEIGTLLELKGENPFKTRAYQNGARTIESLSEPLAKVVAEKRLGEIKGIGVTAQLPSQYAAQQPVAHPGYAPAPQQPAIGPVPAAGPQYVPASQAPTIGLEGYCPVTLLESMKWKKADPKFGAIHRGRTYLFASAAEQQKFLAEPDRFSPILSGCDPVRFAQRGELVEGTRSCGLTFNKQIFLFADEASLKQFEQSPQTYIAPIYQAMAQGHTYR